jgi:hypothetical protein
MEGKNKQDIRGTDCGVWMPIELNGDCFKVQLDSITREWLSLYENE